MEKRDGRSIRDREEVKNEEKKKAGDGGAKGRRTRRDGGKGDR